MENITSNINLQDLSSKFQEIKPHITDAESLDTQLQPYIKAAIKEIKEIDETLLLINIEFEKDYYTLGQKHQLSKDLFITKNKLEFSLHKIRFNTLLLDEIKNQHKLLFLKVIDIKQYQITCEKIKTNLINKYQKNIRFNTYDDKHICIGGVFSLENKLIEIIEIVNSKEIIYINHQENIQSGIQENKNCTIEELLIPKLEYTNKVFNSNKIISISENNFLQLNNFIYLASSYVVTKLSKLKNHPYYYDDIDKNIYIVHKRHYDWKHTNSKVYINKMPAIDSYYCEDRFLASGFQIINGQIT